jgi:hypothetical protein
MRPSAATLTVAICLAISPVVLAAEMEEVMMKDGFTARVEVLETGPETVTVKFRTKGGKTGQTRLRANDMDPYSFYEIRAKHMEKTAENHVKLAIFCASAGLFHRARRQMDAARALDPEIEEKIRKMPEISEGIANHLAEAARRCYRRGEVELCYEIASLVATTLPETAAADRARAVLNQLAAEVKQREEEAEREREAAIEREKDREKKKEAKHREKVLDPIENSLELGRKYLSAGLMEKNQTRAKRAYESAATEFTKLLDKIDREMKSATDDPVLLEQLVDLDAKVRKEGVRAYLDAGNVALSRGSRPEAMKYAQAALALDADSNSAKSFLQKVQLASAMSGWGRWR